MVSKLIVFIFLYILIAFPLSLFTEEVFPFSRFPMYATNTLTPCGFRIHFSKNDESVALKTSSTTNLFLRYSQDVIEKNSSFTTEMCQFIREVFWPKDLPHDSFYVKRYCTDIKNLPSLEFSEQIVLVCR